MKRSFSLRGLPALLRHLGCLCLAVLAYSGHTADAEIPGGSLPPPVLEAQRLSGRADVLVANGREQEAAQLYLDAHLKFQTVMEKFFEIGLRVTVKEHSTAEEDLLRSNRVVAELRDLNLTKLWILLDPDDRAYTRMLEEERADLLRRFPQFTSPQKDDELIELLLRLYPDAGDQSRQLETLREGRLPLSARWGRLNTGR